MRYEQLFEAKIAPLWHSVKFKNAGHILNTNAMEPRTGQRWWPNGSRKIDDEPGYDDSFWMMGWSMTRDVNYGKSWASVLFKMNQEEISRNFKIIPFNWGYSIRNQIGKNRKKEREEFVVSYIDRRSTSDKQKEWHDLIDYDLIKTKGKNFADWMWEPKVNAKIIAPLRRYVLGIYVGFSKYSIKMEPNDSITKHAIEIMKHPLFSGFYNQEPFMLGHTSESIDDVNQHLLQLQQKYGGTII